MEGISFGLSTCIALFSVIYLFVNFFFRRKNALEHSIIISSCIIVMNAVSLVLNIMMDKLFVVEIFFIVLWIISLIFNVFMIKRYDRRKKIQEENDKKSD